MNRTRDYKEYQYKIDKLNTRRRICKILLIMMIIKKKLYLQKNNSIMMFFFYPFRHYPPPETKEEARARLKFFLIFVGSVLLFTIFLILLGLYFM